MKNIFKIFDSLGNLVYENCILGNEFVDILNLKNNIDLVLSEAEDFVRPYKSNGTTEKGYEVYKEVMNILNSIY